MIVKNDGVLFDLDGVIYRGPHAVAHAVEVINRIDLPKGYVTNNASRTPGHVAGHLRELGIDAADGEVATSAQAAAAYVVDTHGSGTRALMVGGDGLRQALISAGITIVASSDDHPVVVVQGTAQTITWAELAEAVYAINAGAHHVATNLDSTMPTERGIALGNGALVAAVRHATGVEVAYAAGKPEPGIFRHAAAQGGMVRPVVVGDRLDTDITGANRAGFDSMVVLTGVASARDVLAARPGARPTYIARDLRALLEPYPALTHTPQGWRCRGATARVSGTELHVHDDRGRATVTGPGEPAAITLDALRAACAAAWEATTPLDFSRDIHILA